MTRLLRDDDLCTAAVYVVSQLATAVSQPLTAVLLPTVETGSGRRSDSQRGWTRSTGELSPNKPGRNKPFLQQTDAIPMFLNTTMRPLLPKCLALECLDSLLPAMHGMGATGEAISPITEIVPGTGIAICH